MTPSRSRDMRLEIWFQYNGDRARELQAPGNRRVRLKELVPLIHADMHAFALVFPEVDFLYSAFFRDAQIRCYAIVRADDELCGVSQYLVERVRTSAYYDAVRKERSVDYVHHRVVEMTDALRRDMKGTCMALAPPPPPPPRALSSRSSSPSRASSSATATAAPASTSAELQAAQLDAERRRHEEELASLRAQLAQVAATYADEQRRRAQAEGALEAVRQERTEPFVVPALMDAFLKLVKLSDPSVLFTVPESDDC